MRREMVDIANPTVEQMARHWFSMRFPNLSGSRLLVLFHILEQDDGLENMCLMVLGLLLDRD